MTDPSKNQIVKWQRRADTLHRKAESLMSEVMGVLGEDDFLTDEIDNILVATSDTLTHLDWRRKRLTPNNKPSNT